MTVCRVQKELVISRYCTTHKLRSRQHSQIDAMFNCVYIPLSSASHYLLILPFLLCPVNLVASLILLHSLSAFSYATWHQSLALLHLVCFRGLLYNIVLCVCVCVCVCVKHRFHGALMCACTHFLTHFLCLSSLSSHLSYVSYIPLLSEQ